MSFLLVYNGSLPLNNQQIALSIIQGNAFAHSENILFAMVTDKDKGVGRKISGVGQRKKQNRKIASSRLPLLYQYHV